MNSYDRDELLHLREPSISRLNYISIEECEEPLVDLRGLYPRLLSRAPLPFVRETVAEMLAAAAASLPEDFAIIVFFALRTLKMQAKSYRRYFHLLQGRHPDWPAGVLRRETNRFLHPPDVTAPPGHCTGGAVDIKLGYANGRLADTISSTRPQECSWATFYPHLTAKARAKRAILYEAMLAAGFSNCADEWWHYSFGDSAWAARTGNPCALYDIPIDLPPDLARMIPAAEKRPLRPLPR